MIKKKKSSFPVKKCMPADILGNHGAYRQNCRGIHAFLSVHL